jgi:hypothetical protein
VILKATQTLSAKSSSPARHAVGRTVQAGSDIDVLHPLGRVEHDPRALHHPEGQRHRRRAPLKLDAFVLRQLDHMPAGPGHDHYFAAPRQPPLHNPQNLRTRPLAKTLWTLATGLEFPLPGEYRLEGLQIIEVKSGSRAASGAVIASQADGALTSLLRMHLAWAISRSPTSSGCAG